MGQVSSRVVDFLLHFPQCIEEHGSIRMGLGSLEKPMLPSTCLLCLLQMDMGWLFGKKTNKLFFKEIGEQSPSLSCEGNSLHSFVQGTSSSKASIFLSVK